MGSGRPVMSSKAALLAATSLQERTFTVDGIEVRLRELSYGEFVAYLKARDRDPTAAVAKLLQTVILEPVLSAEEALQAANKISVGPAIANFVIALANGKEKAEEADSGPLS